MDETRLNRLRSCTMATLLCDKAGGGKYFDWSLGAAVTVLGNVSLGVAYSGVEGPSIDGFTDDTVAGSVTFSF